MYIDFFSLNMYVIHVLWKLHFIWTFLAGYFNTYHMFVIDEWNLQSYIPKVEMSHKIWKYISMKNKNNFFTSNICTSCKSCPNIRLWEFSRYIGLGPGDSRGGLWISEGPHSLNYRRFILIFTVFSTIFRFFFLRKIMM